MILREIEPLLPMPDNLIICAANRHKITGRIVLGIRHGDTFMNQHRDVLKDPGENEDWQQGFIDKYGSFHTRTKAWIIAVKAGQIRRHVGGNDLNGGPYTRRTSTDVTA